MTLIYVRYKYLCATKKYNDIMSVTNICVSPLMITKICVPRKKYNNMCVDFARSCASFVSFCFALLLCFVCFALDGVVVRYVSIDAC